MKKETKVFMMFVMLALILWLLFIMFHDYSTRAYIDINADTLNLFKNNYHDKPKH